MRIHGSQQEDDQRHGEGDAAPQRQALDPADGFGIADLAGDEGQVEKDKAQHDHAIEDAFDDDGRQRSRDGHIFAAFEHHRAQHFAGAGGVDIVAHIANADMGNMLRMGIFLSGRSR